MKPNDRAHLTAALRDHVAKIAADLRAKMRASGSSVRAAAEQLHKDERVAEDFEVWTDLLSRRAAVLWVLKSVYVRVLEDRGLLAPGRLLDPEAQQLFEKLAPNLGETAFLRWIYKDLASTKGGVPELFSPQPAEVALPSDELSRALIALWRHRDADTGAVWSFAEEKFEGELMGDLYQELDPVVKDRFALCQTPDFVRAFILDRTLTPAIETFGADEVRLLDPACGSGHFLIDGLKRLIAATAEKHKDWPRDKVVVHALDRVVGVDLNDYACALARTRLIMTAAELAGVTKLADAAGFHPHVYWADGLEQVERDEQKPTVQFDLFTQVEERPRATLTRSDVRSTLRKVFERKFHAVVANPPYIVESDEARKEYHRATIGRSRRYVSAYKEYSLGSPFTERSFALAEPAGFVGIITGNNFTKGDFGKPLIEKVLAGIDLALVVDASQAFIPHHGTPTILLFGRKRRPESETVRVCLSGRGETGIPTNPARGRVWTSIVEGWNYPGYANEHITVVDMPRTQLAKHPWALKGGGAATLKLAIEERAAARLGALGVDMGSAVLTRADEAYLSNGELRQRFSGAELRPYASGKLVRDWVAQPDQDVLFPYDKDGEPAGAPASVLKWLWPYRARLWLRREPNGDHREVGLSWWEWSRFIRRRYSEGLQLVYAHVSTHNHFALLREPVVLGRHAPVIRLRQGADEREYLATLAVLNSSIACFWMRQVSKDKGGGTDKGKWQSDPAKVAYEFSSTKLEQFPMPAWSDAERERLADLSAAMEELALDRNDCLLSVLPNRGALRSKSAKDVTAALSAAEDEERRLLRLQVAMQEEIDWQTYALYGLTSSGPQLAASEITASGGGELGARPFEMLQARAGRSAGVDGQQLLAEVPSFVHDSVAHVWRKRATLLESADDLRVLEQESFKRRWMVTPKHLAGRVERFDDRLRIRLEFLIEEAVEEAVASLATPATGSRIAAVLADDRSFGCLLEVAAGRPDYDLERGVVEVLQRWAVPNHLAHVLAPSGLVKRQAWERVWAEQRLEDEQGADRALAPPPLYEQRDFVEKRIYDIRGKFDVPKERFIAFTEVPGRSGVETLYGWAGWAAQQRVKAILTLDEELEDASVPLADRIGLLDSAWRLLPDVAREDAASATRLKAELQALVGLDGPSTALIEDWKKRFPPPTTRAARARKAATMREDDESDTEESDEP